MRQNKRYIAVTGGIGSGKSTVLAVANELGFPVFSADAIARGIYEDPQVRAAVRAAFPTCVSESGVDRAALADAVFADAEKLQTLNAATHPAILRLLWQRMRAADGSAVFAEVPLLFEGGYEKQFDRVIVVLRPQEERIAALKARDGLSREQALARIKNQFAYEKNDLNGHTVLYNDVPFSSFRERAAQAVLAAAKG